MEVSDRPICKGSAQKLCDIAFIKKSLLRSFVTIAFVTVLLCLVFFIVINPEFFILENVIKLLQYKILIFGILCALCAAVSRKFVLQKIEHFVSAQQIIENAVEGIAELNQDGYFIFVNDAFARTYGYKPEDMSGMHWMEVIYPDDIPLSCAELDRVIQRNGNKVTLECRGYNKSKKFFHQSMTFMPRYGEGLDRRCKGYFCFIRDISSLKDAEDNAFAKHHELRQVFDHLPVVIFYKDDANNILRVNRLGARTLGRPISDIEGKSTFDLFPEQAEKYFSDDLQVFRRNKPHIGIIEEYIPSHGKKSWVKTDKIPFHDPVSGQRRILVIAQDITKNKLAEIEKMKLIDKLEQINKELSRFVFICSHDLQEPIRMISTYMDKLHEALSEHFASDARLEKYYTYISNGTSKAKNMLESFRLFAELSDTGDEAVGCDIKSILDCICQLERTEQGHKIDKITYDDMPMLCGHQHQIMRLFHNLINNSIKFQPEDQKALIHISSIEAQDHYIFTISDNGVGLDPGYSEKVFDVFQQLHRSDLYPGAGMGLTIAKRIVETHGGEIKICEAKEGFKTTIEFSLLKNIMTQPEEGMQHEYKQFSEYIGY
ncbi:MAG: PAS domain S-box protein [Pseudomonadota bacterium]